MKRIILLLLAAALLLTGCSMVTVDQMYRPPKRSNRFHDLQSAMDQAMAGKEYCAPLTGENQQTVQAADLDGDGKLEYLLFARDTSEKNLYIFIFSQSGDKYILTQTIQSAGASFDRVEYAQMDGRPGQELVVGRQISDQVLRSVSAYSFSGGETEQIVSANYTHFLTADMDGDQQSELMVLCPGGGEVDNGAAVLYRVPQGVAERSREAALSEPVEWIKRIITGRLHGGSNAVYVASTVDKDTIITDVLALVDGELVNVSLSNESGTSVQTLRNYYIYADDIDADGEVELPDLIPMPEPEQPGQTSRYNLIRWYAMGLDGSETDKMFTFHNFVGGWYIRLDDGWARRVSVEQNGGVFDFYLRDGESSDKIFSVYAFTGQDKEQQAESGNRFLLFQSDSTAYAAELDAASGTVNITRDDLIQGFHLIHQDWKTGET